MLGKKSRPVIGIIAGTLISGNKSGLAGDTASPRSPKGPKSFDFGVVGLGIVAALEKSGDANGALFGRNLSRSIPIPVSARRNGECLDEMERESLELEEYTIVTCRIPNKACTKVYCDGRRGDDRTPFRIPKRRASVFHISPARLGEAAGAPATDFLSSCDLCHKKLQGEDIYMYRGEKAFCSTECRYKHIVMDERKEKCRSEASRTLVDVLSTSPVANSPIFTTGILAI